MRAQDAADVILGIDHTLVGVRDLEAARSVWQELGFTLTPRGRHIGWGTGNYCIMLDAGYIELLGIVDPTQFLNNLDSFIKIREGLMAISLGMSDAASLAKRFQELGIAADGPKDLKRKLELPEGDVLPEFSLLFPPPSATPDLKLFFTQHLTPAMIRRPEWQRHANRARRLVSVTVVAEDPVKTALGYLPIFGPDRVRVSDAMTTVDTGMGAIRFVSPQGLKVLYDALLPLPKIATPWIAAMKLEVSDKNRCRDFLKDKGVPFEKTGKGCLVPPEVANGCILEFVQG